VEAGCNPGLLILDFIAPGVCVTAVQCLVVADEGRCPASRVSFSFLRDPPLVDNGPMVAPRAFYDSRPPKASLIRESGSITTTSSSWAQTAVAHARA
jgi:hypothetical protein